MALVASNATDVAVQAIPEAAPLLARHCLRSVSQRRHLLVNLSDWACAGLVEALALLNGKEGGFIETRSALSYRPNDILQF
eukprot:scaffold672476_cov42-Prasinocladus_malaysianus.AAC.1